MNLLKLIKSLLSAFLLLLSVSCTTLPNSVAVPSVAYTRPPFCAVGGLRCTVADAMDAPIEAIRTNGTTLDVDCEKRIETKVDGPYMVECKRQVDALAASLSIKWHTQLIAIDTRTIRYDWKAWDCVDGVGFGFCRYYGIAKISLQWVE